MKPNSPPRLRTCVAPEGHFVYGIHKPAFSVRNLRREDHPAPLGVTPLGQVLDNQVNFPPGDVASRDADWVYEIPNAFPFKGCTLIAQGHAERFARDPAQMGLAAPPPVSFSQSLRRWMGSATVSDARLRALLKDLPGPLQLALAVTSTDARELVLLAEMSCQFHFGPDGTEPDGTEPGGTEPAGLVYDTDATGAMQPCIDDHLLYEALANNPYLPDGYKRVMVLRPGAQGHSPIVGDWHAEESSVHIFEYLRANSYIPWGHYAANLADDTIGYHIRSLTPKDLQGLRHLYYQRTCVRLAESLNLPLRITRRGLTPDELEDLRQTICDRLATRAHEAPLPFANTIWGWNYGFDLSASKYRLNASHQQIHQQYALVPKQFETAPPGASLALTPYCCGDLIADFVREYRAVTDMPFFEAYIQAIHSNRRMDANARRPQSLVVYADDRVMLFVPKAQTSQWELQLLPLAPVGHVLEADRALRASLDYAIWLAITLLAGLGASLITSIEYARRFEDPQPDMRLLYAFLPRLPMSPGAFSEAQMRWVSRHYPEDFAEACRQQLVRMADAPPATAQP